MKITLNGPSLHAGELNLGIQEIARRCPELFSGCGLLVVTIDSGRDLSQWVQDWVSKRGQSFTIQPVGKAVFVPGEAVSWFLEAKGLLVHFDELYVMASDWTNKGLGEIPSFTVDGCSFGEGVPREFQEFFLAIGALRYFTDGSGFSTNYCVSSIEEAAALERAGIRS